MKHLSLSFAAGALLLAGSAAAQDLTNAGSTITVQPGALLYVGSGFTNQAGGTLLNPGTVRVDGPLLNSGVLDLSSGTLEARGDVNTAGGLVLSGTSLVIFTGTADQLLTAGKSPFYRVRVVKTTPGANTLRLAGDATATAAFSLSDGMVNTRSSGTLSTLHLPDGAILSGEGPGRYVLGNVEITRANVGTGPVDFGHGAVLDPAGNSLGTVVITRSAGLLTLDVSHGQNFTNNALKGIDRIWRVAPAQQPTAPVRLALSWLPDNDNGLSDFSQARVYQQPAAGQPWAYAGPVANANGTRTITGSPTVLDRFTVSNAASPLPVTLVEFAARAEGPAVVRLSWATASELNNRDFTVERSRTGANFTAIGTVAGAGTSQTRHDYALLDRSLPAGATLLYYRLRQNDLNGTFTYSPVRTVALAPQAAGFVIFPTKVPVGERAQYLYTGPDEPGTLEILNSIGQTFGTVAIDGRPSGTVPLANLASGAYLVRYTGPAGRFTTRLVVD